MFRKLSTVLLLLFFWCSGISPVFGAAPKNVILFIGDGMGLAQVTAGKIVKGKLEMERCPVTGLVTTWSSRSLVTDSAAAATALAALRGRVGALYECLWGPCAPASRRRVHRKGQTSG